MAQYSIQKDQPVVRKPVRRSIAASASILSDDNDNKTVNEDRFLDDSDMPPIPPLKIHKASTPQSPTDSDPNVIDNGPKVRESRLPIFKQVRSMLHKPTALKIPADRIKYDEFSGNMSETGKAPEFQAPSRYKPPHNPYKGAFEVVRNPSPSRRQKRSDRSLSVARSISPVSMLREDERFVASPQYQYGHEETPPSPVSPISDVSPDYYRIPLGKSPSTVNESDVPETPSNAKAITRKSVASRASLPPDDIPKSTRDGEPVTFEDSPQLDHISRFSWSTYAASFAQPRPSLEADTKPPSRHSKPPNSRFSWSTVNTNMTNHKRPDTPPESPPPAVPSKFKTLPVQSILSRQRPIQRADREVWTPPPRDASLAASNTPTPYSSYKTGSYPHPQDTQTPNSGRKQLPLPPGLDTTTSVMSHLETLLASEQDKVHQRRNILKAINELEKKETASPLDVSFTELRVTRKKLEEHRKTLAEVQLEEREIGIAISRARRKEGEEEGLWVRRVTG